MYTVTLKSGNQFTLHLASDIKNIQQLILSAGDSGILIEDPDSEYAGSVIARDILGMIQPERWEDGEKSGSVIMDNGRAFLTEALAAAEITKRKLPTGKFEAVQVDSGWIVQKLPVRLHSVQVGEVF